MSASSTSIASPPQVRVHYMYSFMPLLLLLLLLSFTTASAPGPREGLMSSKGLQAAMKQSSGAISRLHKTVSKYKRDLQEYTQLQALLSDCEELSSDSQDAVRQSMSILVRMLEEDHRGSNRGNVSSSEEMVDLMRTNLSAALTDITTCTDGLHDELQDESPQSNKAVRHIDKEASRASQLLSKALSIAASAS